MLSKLHSVHQTGQRHVSHHTSITEYIETSLVDKFIPITEYYYIQDVKKNMH